MANLPESVIRLASQKSYELESECGADKSHQPESAGESEGRDNGQSCCGEDSGSGSGSGSGPLLLFRQLLGVQTVEDAYRAIAAVGRSPAPAPLQQK